MRTRIAVTNEDTKTLEALRKAVGHDQDVIPLRKNTPLPANAVAVVGSADAADALVAAAAALGKHHLSLLLLLAEALDAREGLVTGASERLLDHASRYAEAVNLNADDTLTVQRGALLHDLGKMRISNDVLLKKSLLTYDEWSAIRSHTHAGADLAASLPGLADLDPILRYHHENFDGTGYPDKLEGDAIPYLARIMKVLDVYCSMTSPRHYRQTVSSHDEAIDFLKTERGKHFDPEIVDVFIAKRIGKTS